MYDGIEKMCAILNYRNQRTTVEALTREALLTTEERKEQILYSMRRNLKVGLGCDLLEKS